MAVHVIYFQKYHHPDLRSLSRRVRSNKHVHFVSYDSGLKDT